MSLLLRAIITGFGFKVGVELAKYVTEKLEKVRGKSRKDGKDPEVEDLPDGITSNVTQDD
jgi:hypothetical protein